MIVYSAVDLLAGLLMQRPGLRGVLYWAVGLGDPAWDAALPAEDPRTSRLVNEIFRKPLDPTQVTYVPDTRQLNIRVSFGPDEAIGVLREFGIFGGNATATPDSGYLVSYQVHARIDKTVPQPLDRTVQLRLGQRYRAFDLLGGLLANNQLLTGISYWAVGTGDPSWDVALPAADPSTTRLRNEIYRKPIDPALQASYELATRTLAVQSSFGPDEAPAVLREFGIFGGDASATPDSGYLVNYQVHAAIDKSVPRELDRTLRFTLGPPPSVSVPSLVGQTEANARLAATQALLAIGTVTRSESDTAPTGTVISQTPAAAALVASGIAVSLVVASPVTVGVPDLTGLQSAAAAQALLTANLRLVDPPAPTIESTAAAGTVVAQSPAAGARAPRGGAVTVTLATARTVEIPNVVGLPVDDAQAQLAGLGLTATANAVATQERTDFEPGIVVAQTPAAATRAPIGSPVQLATAVAPTAVVPAVVGATPKDAGETLGAANLLPGALTQEESDSPVGTVIRQDPVAGSRAPRGGTVSLVSAVAMTAVVPDLSALALAEATTALTAAQLALDPAAPESRISNSTPGSVVDQAPAAGTRVPRGSLVKVFLATPQLVEVPQLVNTPLKLARELLSTASLTVKEPPIDRQTDQSPPGTVLVQDPAAATFAAVRTAVTLTVAVPVQVALPNLVGATPADASQTLVTLGLALDPVTPTRESDATPGTIVEQNPVAGTSVRLNVVVHVIVGTPRMVQVPSVIGLASAAAGVQLTALGLSIAVTGQVVSAQAVGTVVQQSPQAGQQAQVGSAVSVSVARAAIVLTAALGPEPDTLFLPATSMLSAHHVLRALYDGPFDEQKFTYQPVIFDGPPDIQTQQVSVAVGQAVVVSGRVTTVPAGTAQPTPLPQMRVTFRLRKDLRWDDGTPLTSVDSVFSFGLASDASLPASRFRVARTASYKALDDFTLTWWGLPGWTDASVERNFWTPLPRHVLAGQSVPTILGSSSVRKPLSYGPFRVVEWQAGDHITLERHPDYFRAAEGLPLADQVVLRLVGHADAALSQVVAGNLQLALTGSLGLNAVGSLRQAVNSVNAELVDGNVQTYLMFGIGTAQGPSKFFVNPLVRQAFALAIDRDRIVKEILGGNGVVSDSLVPPSHPAHVVGLTFKFDPTQARALLTQAGWTISPRGLGLSQGGQPFAVTLMFADFDPLQAKLADLVSSMLGQLGIRVTPRPMPASTLYARGKASPLYGRQFDLALVDWTAGIEPPADLFLSEEVSADANAWGAPNVSGYSNADFDGLVLSALSTLDAAGRQAFWSHAQVLFGRDVPALPLFGQLRVAATSKNFVGFALDPSQESEMWNVERFAPG